MHRPTIRINTRHGYQLNAFEGDAITQAIQQQGVYDPNTLEAMREITSWIQPRVSLDIGANIGNNALVLSEHSKQVVAFEPVSQVYDLLRENILLNHKNHIEAYPVAVSNNAGQQTIYLNTDNIGSSSLNAFAQASSEQNIITVIGDVFLQSHQIQNIDFIKIDVEGFEGQVIEGLKTTIQSTHPVILLEWRSPETRSYFLDNQLLTTHLSGYDGYSLGHSASKKSIGHGLKNTLKRLKNTLTGASWGLYPFDAGKSYSNVLFVPKEKGHLFKDKVNLGAN